MAFHWAMRLLFLAAWSVGCGEAFRCYTCAQPTPIDKCKTITQCKLEDTACKTILEMVESEFPFNQSPMVTRSCSSSCLATDPDGIGVAHPVFCCFRDLCNSGQPGLATGL
ncbi:secreted Ly-6/uPAR-related protein 1 [Nannospalax galili]|uniref:Secreted Ly6/Plaur domain containing 1 n=1 Tax=Nannospalax galili TaxID=1026970 RepID=A0A8C6R6N2_NANGA|nr:secreted Ly-6/uPAR-related protein 1 [Nannospalax galili]